MIKLIACDLDGTLLNDNKKIDDGIFDIISVLKQNGILFTIASGRNEELLNNYIDELNIDLPYITNNGGNIYQNHVCLYNDFIPAKYNNVITDILSENNIAFRAFCHDHIIYNLESEFFIGRLDNFNQEIIYYHKDLDLSNYDIYKITCDYSIDVNLFDKLKPIINNLCPELSMFKAEKDVFCLNNVSANKGDALAWVCDKLNIDIATEVLAIGDNENDLPMLNKVKVSAVTGNCDDFMKDKVDYVCNDNNHNGVSEFLKDYFKEIL